MNLLAAVANSAWLASAVPGWHRFRRALRSPAETQEALLRRLLRRNARSLFGREHGFGEIRTYTQFCARVPVVDYARLEPYVTRIRCGEQNVLTAEKVTRLLPTSGSTTARKLIPFTDGQQRDFNAAIDAWLVDLCGHYPRIVAGSSYWSITPAIYSAEHEDSRVPIGFDNDSAYLGGFRQRLVDATLAVPPAVTALSDLDSFRYATLLSLLRREDLRFISVWHPSFFTLLLDALPSAWEELICDIQRGSCRRAESFPHAVRAVLNSRAQPRRAAELRDTGPFDPARLWRDLQVVSCWGDGQAAQPLAALRARLPGVSLQSKGLFATEGFVTIPFQGVHPVALTSHFFEFCDARDTVCPIEDLRVGEQYSVILTTSGGIWRYRLGDLVEVDDVLGATPSLRFLGRGCGVSDLCGEKLAEHFVARATADVFAAFDMLPPFAMLAPENDARGPLHYTLYVDASIPHGLAPALDDALRKNPHYALCRELQQLGPLRCARTQSGATEIFFRTQGAAGQRVGEIKPQSLSLRSNWRQLLCPANDDAGCRGSFRSDLPEAKTDT